MSASTVRCLMVTLLLLLLFVDTVQNLFIAILLISVYFCSWLLFWVSALGPSTSSFLSKALVKSLLAHPSFPTDLPVALPEVFEQLDSTIMRKGFTDGSTGCVVLLTTTPAQAAPEPVDASSSSSTATGTATGKNHNGKRGGKRRSGGLGNFIYCANTGDSRAVLFSKNKVSSRCC